MARSQQPQFPYSDTKGPPYTDGIIGGESEHSFYLPMPGGTVNPAPDILSNQGRIIKGSIGNTDYIECNMVRYSVFAGND